MTIAPLADRLPRDDDVGRLYDRHSAAVLRYCLVALGSFADAEDAVSETYARLLRAKQITPPRHPVAGDPERAWVFGVARNVVREHKRWRRRHPSQPIPPEATDRTALTLDELAIDSDELRSLRTAIDRLSDDHRQVILLRFAAGLTSDETGQVLGKSAGAVRIQQLRALEQLKLLLADPRGD